MIAMGSFVLCRLRDVITLLFARMVVTEWEAISEDFPGINTTLVDKMLLFMDIRYVSDFIRQV